MKNLVFMLLVAFTYQHPALAGVGRDKGPENMPQIIQGGDGQFTQPQETTICGSDDPVVKQHCEESWNAFADIVKAIAPHGAAAMGQYSEELKRADYQEYVKNMNEAFSGPPQARCLKAITKWEYGTAANGHKMLNMDGKRIAMTVRKRINGKDELFVFDGDTLFRIDSPMKTKSQPRGTMLSGLVSDEISGFRTAKKTPIWSVSRLEKEGDGRISRSFPADAAKELSEGILAGGFTDAMTVQRESVRGELASACANVANVKAYDIRSHRLLPISELADRYVRHRTSLASEPADVVTPNDEDCIDCRAPVAASKADPEPQSAPNQVSGTLDH